MSEDARNEKSIESGSSQDTEKSIDLCLAFPDFCHILFKCAEQGLYCRYCRHGAGRDQLKQALDDFVSAVVLDPKFIDAYYAIAAVQKNLGHYEDAIKNLDKILELEPMAVNAKALKKLILTKYLECVLMCLFFFFFIWLPFFLRNNVGDAGLTANQNKMLTIFVLFAFIKTCGYFAFTTFFFFIAWSVAPGIVALLVSAFLMPMLFTMLDGFLKTDFSEFYFNGMIDNAYASIAAGDIGYTLLLAIVLYIGGALLLTALVFRKKEIEF